MGCHSRSSSRTGPGEQLERDVVDVVEACKVGIMLPVVCGRIPA
ncbi:hypothetical protein HMPREF9056_02684 [Actinomyces sp. oral taxon 170 str. F0386]|nr:hypothetical protein HMPREF9056_02684 [Actinomyces sp. oral taxon 170 str. F0386]